MIRDFEGCVLHTYDDGFGNKTIGVGHVDNSMSWNKTITQAEADDLLRSDLRRFEENVNFYDPGYDWNQNEYDSLVSFAFNLGNVDELLRNGKLYKEDIPERMLLFCHANGEIVEGLQIRRKKEAELFMTPVECSLDVPKLVTMTAEVCLGKYGNGDERKQKLGNNYDIVQDLINIIYKEAEKLI